MKKAKEAIDKFQFLIDRLKTKFLLYTLQNGMMFQFLIGRLKTIQQKIGELHLEAFQFLVGRLKTSLGVTSPDSLTQVSIPSR